MPRIQGRLSEEANLSKHPKFSTPLVAFALIPILAYPNVLAARDSKAGKESQAVAAQDAPAKSAGQTKSGASLPPDTSTPSGYRVGVEDELSISVWHEPELSQQVVVRPDGMITLPLLNDVKVAGLTMEELQALLVEKLKAVVNDPQVTVSVKAVKSRRVFLVGNVAKQGVYPLAGHMTVLELIAEAGGLGPFAKGNAIYVLRKENGKEVHLPFSYKKALSGKGANPELLPGDMVVVP
jgi:polysaccharide biosynthesis/export protein